MMIEAAREMMEKYRLGENSSNGTIITSTSHRTSRLVCKSRTGKSLRLSDKDIALLGVRHIHRGNMYHPPSEETEIEWRA